MGTDYYALDNLFSSLKLDENEQHCKVTLFIRGQNIGTLCAGNEDRYKLLNLFFNEDVGKNRGEEPGSRATNRQVMSEYGEVEQR